MAHAPGSIERPVHPAPYPAPVEQVQAAWHGLSSRPELACVDAWSAACRSWWRDPHDRRLHDRSRDGLQIGADELAGWLARRLDRAALIDAHAHVTAMRAGLERDVSRRHLTTGAVRAGQVMTSHRDGSVMHHVPAAEVPARVDRVCKELDQLPAHPLLRAAWIAQAIGAVHPFNDGNGGTCRFLASVELARASLPPLTLSVPQRNGPYIDAVTHANRTGELDRLVLVVHDVVQQGLAAALLAGTGGPATWDARARARADGWVGRVDRSWRAAVGDEPLTFDDATTPAAIARLVRRGYRLPAAPAPRCARWRVPAPIPLQLDLAIAPVRTGADTWLVAVVGGSVADDGELGAVHADEAIAAVLVAAAGEPDDEVDARFQRWLDVRLQRCVHGLAPWL